MAIVYRVVRQKYAALPLDVTGTWLKGSCLFVVQRASLTNQAFLLRSPKCVGGMRIFRV